MAHTGRADTPRASVDRPVRAVSLDIWGTLVRSDPRFKPARNEVLRAALVPGCAADEFDAVLRQADRDADDECIADGRDRGLRERLDLALTRLESAGHETARGGLDAALPPLIAEQERLARQFHPVPLHDDLPALLVEVARLVPVALTSNTGMLPGTLMRPLLDASGLLGPTQVHVFSNEVGWCKPRPEIFAETVDELAAAVVLAGGPVLESAEVLHVGDNPVADVDGAQRAGLRASLVATGDDTVAVLRSVLEQARARAAVPAGGAS